MVYVHVVQLELASGTEGRDIHLTQRQAITLASFQVPCLSPFLFISLSVLLPHDLYISYSFAPYEELGIYAYPSASTLRWTAAVCCRTDHRWEIPVPWQQTHICSIVSPSRALCGSDHAPFHQRAAYQRAYIDGVDIFIILTKALKYVNPPYFS